MEEENLNNSVPQEAPAPEQPAPKKQNGFVAAMDRYFGISKAGSTFRTEIVAGLTTFMTMCYILLVNSDMFTAVGVSYGAIYIATALGAIVGTLLMAFLAKLPFAQACGMGLNAFFVFTVCSAFGYGYSYANGLVIILASGILFLLLTVVGIREKIVRAVPTCVRLAIPAGIGLFIAFVGMQNAGIIISDAQLIDGAVSSSTIVKLFPMTIIGSGAIPFSVLMPKFVTILTVIGIAVLSKLKVKGSLLWGILGGTALYYIRAGIFCPDKLSVSMDNPFNAFKQFGTESFGVLFTQGFTGLFSDAGSVFQFIAIFISFAMVDMFDTIGTLLGTAQRANMLDENGEVPNMRKALLCDSIATCTGAIFGTSTVTTFVESSAGIAEGGRTGMTALVVAICFVIAMFLSPIAQLIPSCATAAALIYVGVLMMGCVTSIDWNDAAAAVPAFLTIAMMPLTYSISYGIGFGFISYTLIKLCTGKVKEIHPITAVLTVFFLLNFLLVNHG